MPYVGSNPTPTMDAGQQGSGAAEQVADEGCGSKRIRSGADELPRCPSARGPADTRV
jgi:hypothetical protein